MVAPVSVSLSGPAFSFLLYENSKGRFHQEGFLIGEIVHKETKTITDNDQEQINISRTVKINSVMPCPQSHYFYKGCGKVDADKATEFLGDQFNKVVAWYKYQPISSFKFSVRDKIIHRQLMDLFGISSELFSCCLLLGEVSDNQSTHLLTQGFMRCHNNVYDRLPIQIPNLSEPNNSYKNSEPASETFKTLLINLKIDRKTTQGLVVINKIQNALQKHIDKVVESLSEAEKQIYELEEEIKQLETLKKVKKKNEESAELRQLEVRLENNLTSPHHVSSRSTENSPEIQRRTVSKRGSSRKRGRTRGRHLREPH